MCDKYGNHAIVYVMKSNTGYKHCWEKPASQW